MSNESRVEHDGGPVGARPAALEVVNATKDFGPVRVLDEVNLNVRPGELRALVGENGSGKSTLVKILAGYHAPSVGTRVLVGGHELESFRPEVSSRAGLRFVHQDLGLVADMTVVENLGLGRGYGSAVGRPVRWRSRAASAQRAISNLGYDFDVNRTVGALSASERTAVAVARALADREEPARVLVLDEPTANLPGAEVDRLFALIRRVQTTGIGVVFISHHLNEVFDLADSVTVLRGGRLVTTRSLQGLNEDSLIELMVGRAVHRSTGTGPALVVGEPVLTAEQVRGGSVDCLDLAVAPGEIVGVAGVTGSGREAVTGMLYGANTRSGRVTVNGAILRPGRPDASLKAGMALVPAERAANAVLPGHDVRENFTIGGLSAFRRWLRLNKRRERAVTQEWLARMDVRPPEPAHLMTDLSGGNAQKVVLARWLSQNPSVLILDEPTQGVDVGAKQEIHRRIEEVASQGCAVLVASTDNEELARLCTRTLVMTHGRVTTELSAGFHPDTLTAACLRDSRGNES